MKSNVSKLVALVAMAIIILTVGIMSGMRMARPVQEMHVVASSSRGNATAISTGNADATPGLREPRSHETKSPLAASPAQDEIMRNIRDAMLLPQESRTAPLLKALEETTKLSLSKGLLDEMRRIVDEGEIESSHYVISLMEQREEKSSVDFLLHAATHQNPDVADRALFALEAVAGTVFKSREEAAKWAENWQADAERVKLFAPSQEKEDENPIANDTRLPGPRAFTPKGAAIEPE